ncbi:MAG: hypothetical protein AAF597_13475, partial [Bacteroidota bacterium]
MPSPAPKTGLLLLLLALALGAALRVPGWYTQEIMERYRLFETDEEQHIAIALHRYNNLTPVADSVKHDFKTAGYNVRGYGHLVATVVKVTGQLGGNAGAKKEGFRAMLLTGRALSTLFALLLVVVTYRIGRVSGLDPFSLSL